MFGCGAIGLGVVATSALVKASRIIAVDTNPGKESWARKFGATDFVNPAKLPEGTRIQDHLVDITDGGLDYTFDCTGNVRTIRLECLGAHSLILTSRFMLCAPLSRLATRAGVSAPLLVSPPPVRKSLLGRTFIKLRAQPRHRSNRDFLRFQLVTGRTWRGSAFGGVKGRTEIPGLVDGA